MSDQPRDWDREMAEIDKVIAREAPPQARAPVPAGRAAAPAVVLPAGAGVTRRARAAGWLRVLLAVAVAVAIPFWPYLNACGLGLALYAGAVVFLILLALWAAAGTWVRRLGFAHFISVAVLLWGLALAAGIVLPRIGYAVPAAAWLCP